MKQKSYIQVWQNIVKDQETDMMSLLVFYRLCRRRHQEQQQQAVRSKGDGHCGRAPWVIVSGREKGHLRRTWSQYHIQSSHHLSHLSSHPLLLLRLCSLPTDLRFASKLTSEDSWSVCSMHSENHTPISCSSHQHTSQLAAMRIFGACTSNGQIVLSLRLSACHCHFLWGMDQVLEVCKKKYN
jgi:hypothetical protein